MSEGSGSVQFDWEALAPLLVPPVRVQIIEALAWVGEPLSASDLRGILGERFTLQVIVYHLLKLAEVGAIEKVHERPVRGAVELFYALS